MSCDVFPIACAFLRKGSSKHSWLLTADSGARCQAAAGQLQEGGSEYAGNTLSLPCVSTAFVAAKALPLPCGAALVHSDSES